MSDEVLCWLLIAPASFFLFSLVQLILSWRHGLPETRQHSDAETGASENAEDELPAELHRVVTKLRTQGGHIEVTRDNGKVAITYEPARQHPAP